VVSDISAASLVSVVRVIKVITVTRVVSVMYHLLAGSQGTRGETDLMWGQMRRYMWMHARTHMGNMRTHTDIFEDTYRYIRGHIQMYSGTRTDTCGTHTHTCGSHTHTCGTCPWTYSHVRMHAVILTEVHACSDTYGYVRMHVVTHTEVHACSDTYGYVRMHVVTHTELHACSDTYGYVRMHVVTRAEIHACYGYIRGHVRKHVGQGIHTPTIAGMHWDACSPLSHVHSFAAQVTEESDEVVFPLVIQLLLL
jgi:hypothetical protein